MKIRDVLGLNSRNHLYTSVYNSKGGKKIANSKLFTKKTLRAVQVRVPKTYTIIESMEKLDRFDCLSLPADFVVKPNNGLGGEGIVVIERRGEYAGEWVDSRGVEWTIPDLKLHMADILAGRYSMDDLPDTAYIEERVRVHPVFERYSYHGTPDIRVIVYNRIPVMSYVRLPTEESGGRANLFQGAAAVGIDIATGITTHGVHHAKPIEFFPGTRRKLANIQVPQWEEILTTAVRASEAIGLGYMAADIVLQPEGETSVPMILEVNAQPGLKIQIANRAGLRERLARVKGLKITSAKHGIRVGMALFADTKLAEKGLGRKTVGSAEEIELMGLNGERESIRAKVDTGANMSSIDRKLAEKLGLLEQDNQLYEDYFFSSLGRKKRQIVGIKYVMAGVKVKGMASVSDRSHMKHKFLVGKRDLKQFAVVVE